MKQNMGSLDRVLRISVALVIAVLYFTDQMSGTAAVVLGLFAMIFALTSFVGFCPLYIPLKLSTKKDQKNSRITFGRGEITSSLFQHFHGGLLCRSAKEHRSCLVPKC
jgi:hypothetical protein